MICIKDKVTGPANATVVCHHIHIWRECYIQLEVGENKYPFFPIHIYRPPWILSMDPGEELS